MARRVELGDIADCYSVRWWIDLLVLAVAVGLWLWRGAWAPAFTDAGAAYYASVSSFAGICLAGATFTCALFFQSSKPLLQHLQKAYAHDARASWTWILIALLVSAAAPIAAAATAPAFRQAAFAIATGSALMASLSFIRVVLWFRLITRAPEGKKPDGEKALPGAPSKPRTQFRGLGPRA